MELSRQSIERADFPRVADGLDPEAVAEHLRAVAEAVEQLARSGAATAARPSSGERVRAIVDAAERSAAELEASARADADRVRAGARADLERLRRLAAEIGDRADAVARELDQPAAEPPPLKAQPPQAEPEPQPEPAGKPSGAAKAGAGEAPRLIALNMVLDGASREQVAQYLDENFDLEDPGELLDEVWSSAGAGKTRS